MKPNYFLIGITTSILISISASADVGLFHPGKTKKHVNSMKEDIEHNREQIFTDGVELNSLKMKVSDQEIKINYNKKLIDEHKESIQKNKSEIENTKESILEQQQLIDNNERNTIINENKIKINQENTLINSKNIIKNSQKIADAYGLISENTSRIDQVEFNQQMFETKTDLKFADLDKRISNNHYKAMAGVSSAMSMSAIPFVEGKRFSFGLGAGSYGGQGATALGAKVKLNSNFNASAYGSYDSTGNVGVAAGMSLGW